jgi:DNA polymerase IV
VRTIFHLDMDAFFVSVEELFDPSLKGKAVVVGGGPNERGVVSAASYEARKFGVHSAMPLRTASQKCPHAVFIPGSPARYREYSGKVFDVLQTFSPKISMASIDEAYLDLTGTGRLLGNPMKAGHDLHEAIGKSTGLNCSIGISTSRLVSKVASDQAKPNGVLWVQPGQEQSFLGPLDVRRIPGVGKVSERHLHECGIRQVRDLANLEPSFLEKRFGKWGMALAGKSRGLDSGAWFESDIGDHSDPKSISHEHTFNEDTRNTDLIEATIAHLSEKVGRRLREHSLYARNIHIKLRYHDFSTFTRSKTLDHSTQIDTEILDAARMLFQTAWTGAAIRLLGVYAGSLETHEGQLNLMAEGMTERWRKALGAMDRIRDKYGERSVSIATGLKGVVRERVHENPAGLPGQTRKKQNP